MRFLVRTGLATGAVVIVLALSSVSWREYSARSSCASVGSPASSLQTADGTSAYRTVATNTQEPREMEVRRA